MIPTVVAVILWKWLLNNQFGLVNYPACRLRPDRPADQLDGPQLDHGLADPDQRLAVLSLRRAGGAGAPADASRRNSTMPPRWTAPRRCGACGTSPCRSSGGAVRHGAAARHLDVHEVRHRVADHPGRRRREVHPHAAGLRLSAHLQLLPGGHGRGDRGRDVPDSGRSPPSSISASGGGRRRCERRRRPSWRSRSRVLSLASWRCPSSGWSRPPSSPRRRSSPGRPTCCRATSRSANIERLFAQTNFLIYFRNSVFVASCTVVLTLLVSVPGAYGLTRFRYPRPRAARRPASCSPTCSRRS